MGGPEDVRLTCIAKKLTLYLKGEIEMFKGSEKVSFVFAYRRKTKM